MVCWWWNQSCLPYLRLIAVRALMATLFSFCKTEVCVGYTSYASLPQVGWSLWYVGGRRFHTHVLDVTSGLLASMRCEPSILLCCRFTSQVWFFLFKIKRLPLTMRVRFATLMMSVDRETGLVAFCCEPFAPIGRFSIFKFLKHLSFFSDPHLTPINAFIPYFLPFLYPAQKTHKNYTPTLTEFLHWFFVGDSEPRFCHHTPANPPFLRAKPCENASHFRGFGPQGSQKETGHSKRSGLFLW